MATLYIEEFAGSGIAVTGQALQVGRQPSNTTQTVAIGGTHGLSSAFGASTRFVRLHTDSICSFKFGEDPEATTSSSRMAADQTEYFEVIPGQKVSVISNT